MQNRQRIGELARAVQLPPKTIRYYEAIGLLPPAQRSGAGYRLYSPRDVERLSFIRRAKLLGLPLREIKDLVSHAMDGECRHLQRQLLDLLRAKRAEIDGQVQDLLALKADLGRLELQVEARLDSGERSEGVGAACTCLDVSARSSNGRRD